MKIDQHTKISELIKYNSASIDAIASIAKPLQKLKNPILRKLLASRVTIAEAAKIAHCQATDFKHVLIPLGFEWPEEQITAATKDAPIVPEWMTKGHPRVNLDVRPILAGGKDPLKEIFAAYKQLPEAGILCVINTFIPIPLIHKLAEKGALSHVETLHVDEINTYFYKVSAISNEDPTAEQVVFIPLETFMQKLASWDQHNIIETDVREMSMPQPMLTILGLLEELQQQQLLFVHHKKIPLYLLEELADKNYKIFICDKDEGDVNILIHALNK